MAESLKRREVAEALIKSIEHVTKLKCVDPTYGRYYFVFDHDEDGIVHFRVKGCSGWKFAFWLDLNPDVPKEQQDDYPAVSFFGQHVHHIDKFKPSRSLFCVNIGYADVAEGMKSYRENKDEAIWEFYDIGETIKYIHKHPIASYVQDYHDTMTPTDGFLSSFIAGEYRYYKNKVSEFLKDVLTFLWHRPKVWLLNKLAIVDSCKWVDGNSDWCKSYPRYFIQLHFKSLYDEEEQNYRESKLFKLFFRRYYKGGCYKNLHIHLSREGLEGLYSYTERD